MGICAAASKKGKKQDEFSVTYTNEVVYDKQIKGARQTPTVNSVFYNKTRSTAHSDAKTKRLSVQLTHKIDNDIIVNRIEGAPELNYVIEEILSQNNYNQLSLVHHKTTGCRRVLKKAIKPKYGSDDTSTIGVSNKTCPYVVDVMKRLDHPYVDKLYEYFVLSDTYYLVTDYCSGGDLFKYVQSKPPLSEREVAFIIYQLIVGLNVIHYKDVVHRNLNLENILIRSIDDDNNLHIKIIDFSVSKIKKSSQCFFKHIVGSSYYIAPEVLAKHYNEKCDIWSCGVIMYILLCGRPPFDGETDVEIFEKVKFGKYELNGREWKRVTPYAKDFLSKLLTLDWNDRISAKAAISHDWFVQTKVKELITSIPPSKVEKLLSNIRFYNPENQLQEVIIAFIVHNIPNTDDLADITKLFALLDDNKNGVLTRQELYLGLQAYYSFEEDFLDELIAKLDSDKNGVISFEEFTRACLNKKSLRDEKIIKYAFEFFDKDSSGEITIEELGLIFNGNAGVNSNSTLEKELKTVLKEVNIANNIITYDNFKEMMHRILS